MRIFTFLTLAVALLLGLSSSVQAQCSATFTYNNSGQLFNFNAVATGVAPNASYVWTVNDYNSGGTTTLTGQNPSFTFSGTPSIGYHYVCLTVFDTIGCQTTYCDSVFYNTGNPCNFTTNSYHWVDTSAAVNGTVDFGTYGSTGSAPYTYVWDFGDGSAGSTSANPTHVYNNPNNWYWACVTMTDAQGCTAVSCDSVYPNNPCADSTLYAYFQATVNGNTANFTSSIGGNASSLYWSFGDGSSATTANPAHTYNQAGSYTVYLWVTYANGCSRSYTTVVTINGGNPCANFGAYFTSSANGNTVSFLSSVYGGTMPYTYSWDFGDNSTGSTQAHPTHTYNQPGFYGVTLIVTDTNGCIYTAWDTAMTVNGNPCAGFSANFTSSANGNVLNFNSSVVGGTMPYTYSWDFGDNTAGSTQANPTHTYNQAGSYGVLLIVTDANGCAYTVWDTAMTVNSQPCNQNEVILALNFDNYAYETSWDVRDQSGNVVSSGSGYSFAQNGTSMMQALCLPTGCYTFNIYDTYGDGICCLWGNGSYSLTDAVSGNTLASGGAFGYSETTTICVGGATNPCSNFFAQFSHTATAGNVIAFTANASGSGVQYIWDFGDNTTGTGSNPVHTYANTTMNGYYQVCMTAIDSQGCSVTICDSVAVAAPPCNNNQVTLTLNFDNFASETTWDVTDANGNIVYSGAGYTQANNGTTGSINMCLPTGCYDFNIYDSYGDGICCQWGSGSYILTDAAGNVLASGGQFGYADHTNFCVGGASNPCGNFTGSITTSAGSNGAYAFTANFNVQQPFNYQWSFGDGNSSTQANPNHTYANNGTYLVCMTADSGNCVVTYCDTILVTNANNNPGGSPCAGMNVNINMVQDTTNPFVIYMQPVVNNAPTNSVISFVWDFGDNTGAMGGSPGHLYNNYGSYVVCIMAFDSVNGCVATFCDTITLDSTGNFSRNLDYKDVKPGFYVNTLPAIINFNTSVNGIENDNIAIELFPNPAADVVNLNINSVEAMNGEVQILDVAGKAIYSKTVNLAAGQQQLTLPVAQFPAGVYLVSLKGDTAQKTMKFIKE